MKKELTSEASIIGKTCVCFVVAEYSLDGKVVAIPVEQKDRELASEGARSVMYKQAKEFGFPTPF